MKKLLLFSFLLFYGRISIAQTIEAEDIKELYNHLDKGRYKMLFEETNEWLNKLAKDSSETRGVLVYMSITAGAGMVSQGKMTAENFSAHANTHIGQFIVSPGYPCVDSGKIRFNSFQLMTIEGKQVGEITSSNLDATSILAFERYTFDMPVNKADVLNKFVTCSGILESITVNPNQPSAWICRFFVKNAYLREIKTD